MPLSVIMVISKGESGGSKVKHSVTRLFSILALPLLLAGCTATSQQSTSIYEASVTEPQAKICDSMYAQLAEIGTYPPTLEDIALSGDITSNTALLDGKATRSSREKEILQKFPMLDSIILGKDIRKGDTFSTTRFEHDDVILLKFIAETNGINFPLSAGKVSSILKNGDEQNEFDGVVSKVFAGCPLKDSEDSEYRSLEDDYYLSARSVFSNLEEALWAIRSCRAIGQANSIAGSFKCSAEDYVGGDKDYSDGTFFNIDPWTRTWRDEWQEQTAKFTWCFNQQLRFSATEDRCVD